MTAAFSMLIAGGVLLMAAVRNRPITDILRGITSPLSDGGSQLGVTAMSSFPMGSAMSGMTQFDGIPVCGWIAKELRIARNNGWPGKLISGYRSAQHQAEVCAQTTNPCAAPGTSNHQGKRFPGCAADVTEPDALERALPAGSPLRYTGKSIGDEGHFSSGLSGV